MERLEMAPSKEAVTLVCYVLPMGNAWVCIEYLFITIFSDDGNEILYDYVRVHSNLCFLQEHVHLKPYLPRNALVVITMVITMTITMNILTIPDVA